MITQRGMIRVSYGERAGNEKCRRIIIGNQKERENLRDLDVDIEEILNVYHRKRV
jgi:hypothetical protein